MRRTSALHRSADGQCAMACRNGLAIEHLEARHLLTSLLASVDSSTLSQWQATKAAIGPDGQAFEDAFESAWTAAQSLGPLSTGQGSVLRGLGQNALDEDVVDVSLPPPLLSIAGITGVAQRAFDTYERILDRITTDPDDVLRLGATAACWVGSAGAPVIAPFCLSPSYSIAADFIDEGGEVILDELDLQGNAATFAHAIKDGYDTAIDAASAWSSRPGKNFLQSHAEILDFFVHFAGLAQEEIRQFKDDVQQLLTDTSRAQQSADADPEAAETLTHLLELRSAQQFGHTLGLAAIEANNTSPLSSEAINALRAMGLSDPAQQQFLGFDATQQSALNGFLGAPTQGYVSLDSSGILLIRGTAAADTIDVTVPDSNPGSVVVTLNGAIHSFATAEVEQLRILSLAGSDHVSIRTSLASFVNASTGNDTVIGGWGSDELWGGTGNDVLLGREGDDVLRGGAGNDEVNGGLGDDLLSGGSGSNQISDRDLVAPLRDVLSGTNLGPAPDGSAPLVSAIVVLPSTIGQGGEVDLVANNVDGNGGVVGRFEWFIDANGNGVGESDEYLAVDDSSTDGWSARTMIDPSLTPDTYPIVGRAVGTNNEPSVWRSANLTILGPGNQPPTIDDFSAAPATVVRGQNITVSVGQVSDDGNVDEIFIYLDANGNSTPDADEWIGSLTAQGNWSAQFDTRDWVIGQRQLFARAVDNTGLTSNDLATPVNVLVNSEDLPTVLHVLPSLDSRVADLNEVQLIFSDEMETTSVSDVAHYQVVDEDGVDVTIDSVSYDSATRTATLHINPAAILPEGDLNVYVFADQVRSQDGLPLRGAPDIAVALSQGQQVGLLRGNGDGSFLSATPLDTFGEPTAIAKGDVDADGVLDVVVVIETANTVRVYRGLGQSQFEAPLNYVVGSGPIRVALGDLNNDGADEIITTNLAPDLAESITVLVNDGSGNFATRHDFAAPDRAKDVVVGDFDLANGLDFAVSVENTGVLVFYNQGGGTFGAPVTVSADAGGDLNVGYLDEDGYLDLAVATPGSPGNRRFTLLFGNGGGGFDSPVSQNIGTQFTNHIAMADADDDGRNDLVYVDQVGLELHILRNAGNRLFNSFQTLSATQTPTNIEVADFNRDGRDDVLVTHRTTSQSPLSLYLSSPTGLQDRLMQSGGAFGAGEEAIAGEFNGRARLAHFIVDKTAPTVVGVEVASSTWTPDFLAYLEGHGHGTYGYAISDGTGQQLAALPWPGIDEITLRFDSDVLVTQDSLTVQGSSGQLIFSPDLPHGIAGDGFSYDSTTRSATWRLETPIDADRLLLILGQSQDLAGNVLDGEWENPTSLADPSSSSFPSGDGNEGGLFQFRFNILAGDVNGNGAVTTADVGFTRSKVGESSDDVGFTVTADVNANRAITTADVGFVRSRVGNSLPAEEPQIPELESEDVPSLAEVTRAVEHHGPSAPHTLVLWALSRVHLSDDTLSSVAAVRLLSSSEGDASANHRAATIETQVQHRSTVRPLQRQQLVITDRDDLTERHGIRRDALAPYQRAVDSVLEELWGERSRRETSETPEVEFPWGLPDARRRIFR